MWLHSGKKSSLSKSESLVAHKANRAIVYEIYTKGVYVLKRGLAIYIIKGDI